VLCDVSIYFENHTTIHQVTARQVESDATNQISIINKILIFSVFRRELKNSTSLKRKNKSPKIIKVRNMIV
jgi:hypothetical protein